MKILARAIITLFAAAAVASEDDGRNWPTYGGTYSETHFSPLQQIDASSVARLGLAWTLDLDVTNSITVPLAVDGVIYVAAGLGIVHAVDAKSGKLLWRYDPQVAAVAGKKLRVTWGSSGSQRSAESSCSRGSSARSCTVKRACRLAIRDRRFLVDRPAATVSLTASTRFVRTPTRNVIAETTIRFRAPILLDDAPERRLLAERGMEVAVDGLEVKV